MTNLTPATGDAARRGPAVRVLRRDLTRLSHAYRTGDGLVRAGEEAVLSMVAARDLGVAPHRLAAEVESFRLTPELQPL